ncbi:NapC/NirT family cytochrome c [Roseateles violae]|uniref:Cytochrome c-type protein n=1 Tax=Roseateles violae TaxID=3058042 RepID=A0ABT8DVW9_9BURK|nr:NapC/NirT family cytochrome c [Pelomonas sp. PFR6]MDN3922445.1 NapC/NirT family cytochrome c [Pelomonas sp. PFR6]
MFAALRRFWAFLMRPSTKPLLVLLAIGGIGGILFWGGFHTALEATNTMPFCISCHEMRDTAFAEYKETIHYSNRSGVRASCPDCHVPKEWGPKIYRKIEATGELWGSWMGTIDTPEKYEAHRTRLAQKEWGRMKANQSLACRNCHSTEGMSPEKQNERAQARHAKAKAEGMTCIDCHFGIAHNEPEGPGPQELFDKDGRRKPQP